MNNLPGALVRKRIMVTVDELKNVETTIKDDDVLKAAQWLIQTFNFEDSKDEKFIYWGQSLQDKYMQLVKEVFDAVRDGTLEQLGKIRLQIADKLSELSWDNLEKGPGVFSWLNKRSPDESLQKFNIGYEELEDILKRAKDYTPKLLEWKKMLDKTDIEIDKLIQDAEAHIVAGAYLVQYGMSKKDDLSGQLAYQVPTLRARVDSIRGQLATMRNDTLYVQLREQALNLLMLVQDTLSRDIPRWQLLMLSEFTTPQQANRGTIDTFLSRIRGSLIP